jgi:excisionase family DNA binding protein
MSIRSTGLSDHETPRVGSENGQTGPPVIKRVYSIEEVARMLGLSRNAAYVAARENRLPVPVIKVGRRMMVSRAAMDAFLPDAA